MWHTFDSTTLVIPGQTSFWDTFWKSAFFKKLMTTHPDYRKLQEQAMRLPWVFVDSRKDYDRRHFSAWFANTIIRREYDNPVTQDLFHFHDILHALTFEDNPEGTEEEWRFRMRSNEIAVSLETEVLLYFRSPGLREASFDFPIWYDSFAKGVIDSDRDRLVEYENHYHNHPEVADVIYDRKLWLAHPAWPIGFSHHLVHNLSYRQLWDFRRAVSRNPSSNPVEKMLAEYEGFSEVWADGWKNHWREIETERVAFRELCESGEWKQALLNRFAHWEKVSNEDGIPYGDLTK